jgi:hypothetical protein
MAHGNWVEKGEPGSGERVPAAASIANPDMEKLLRLPAQRNLCNGSVASATG